MVSVNKHISPFVLGLSCSVVIIIVYFLDISLNIDILQRLELKTLDYRFLCKGVEQPDGNIVVISIDDKTLDEIEDPLIFWRPYFAKIIKNISEGGANVIGLDIVFPIPLNNKINGVDHDSLLAEALHNANNVTLAETFKYEKENDCYIFDEPNSRLRFAANPENVGFLNVTIDSDNTVRKQTLFVKGCDGKTHISFALALLSNYFVETEKKECEIIIKKNSVELNNKVIPIDRYGNMIINFAGPSGTFKNISFYDVLKKAEDKSSIYFNENFNNKIVLIGTTYFLHKDFKPTPFFRSNNYSQIRSTYGIEILANQINTILQDKYITKLTYWQVFLIILFIGLSSAYILSRLSITKSLIYVAILGVAYLLLSVFMFINNMWIEIVAPLITIPLIFSVSFLTKYCSESKRRIVTKKLFERYLHPAVVNELISDPDTFKREGVKKELTIFFSDIIGFAAIAESTYPEQLIEVINQYYTSVSNAIFKYRGTVDQYAGDAIMAFFGSPLERENHPELACYAAIDSQKLLKEIREASAKNGSPAINVRIGINTGTVIVGNLGHENRFHYTVLGEHVNLAARLEGLNKFYGTDILISEQTYNYVKHSVVARGLDIVRVKGMEMHVKVYELIAKKNEIDDKTLELLEYFNLGLKAFKNKEWKDALNKFMQTLTIDQNDGPTKFYIKKCKDYLNDSPPKDWDGIFVMKDK